MVMTGRSGLAYSALARARASLAVAVALGCLAISPQAAEAGAGIGFTPSFPHEMSVGQRGVSVGVHLSNDSDSSEGSMTVCALGDCPELGPSGSGSVTLTPSCGLVDVSVSCPPAGADPNIFRITSVPTGRVGSACAGQQFDATVVNALSGAVRFEPRVGRVILGPHGAPNDHCDIDFTVDVLKLPTLDPYPARPGLQTVQYGSLAGRTSIRGLLAIGRGSSVVTVSTPPPPPAPAAGTLPTTPSTPTSRSQATPGTARLSAPTGCVPKPFYATVRGRRIRRIVFFLDGRQIGVLRRPNRSGSRYAVRINPRRLGIGAHRIVVKVTFTAASQTRSKRMTVVFQRCARGAAGTQPRFVG